MRLIIIGHWSLDGALSQQHFARKDQLNVVSFEDDQSFLHGKYNRHTPLSLMTIIVELFSFEGQTILDMMSCTGT